MTHGFYRYSTISNKQGPPILRNRRVPGDPNPSRWAALGLGHRNAVHETALRLRGFTVVELLVSMSVISVLLALFLPAIQSARETAGKVSCQNNLRQIVVAAFAYEGTHRYLPGGCGSPRVFHPLTAPNALSAHTELLPHLEQASAYASVDFEENGVRWYPNPPVTWTNGEEVPHLSVFQCPGASLSNTGNSYRFCVGSGLVLNQGGAMSCVCGLRPDLKPHIIRPLVSRITDGLSNSAFATESFVGDLDASNFDVRHDSLVVGPNDADAFAFAFAFASGNSDAIASLCASYQSHISAQHVSNAGNTWALSGNAYTWYSHVLPPNSRISDCTASGARMDIATVTARSTHPTGVNLAYADGSVEFIGNNIDTRIWRRIGRIDDGEGR